MNKSDLSKREELMMKLNKIAIQYMNNYDKEINCQEIAEQMKDFSGAEYVMFNIFDENGKDFTLVGFEGNKNSIKKAMDIIGYNIIGKKFKYEENRNEKFEKSIVTKVESLRELVGNALPSTAISIIEKIFKIDSILTIRITKDEKTVGNFTLIFSENQNRNDNEMLKLFASQVGLFIDKKNSEQKNLESIKRFQSLLKNSVNIITIIDNKGNYVDVSASAAELVGIEKEELIGKNFKEVVFEKAEEFMNTISTINKTKEPIHKEEIYYVNNEERIYESIIFPIEEKDNEVVLFGSIANDITVRKKDEQKIIDIKERLENIIEATNVGTWEYNLETDKEVINSRWAEMLGYSLEQISYNSNQIWRKSIHPDDKEKVEKEFEKLVNGEIEYYNLDVRMKQKSGKYIWINDRAKVTKWTEDGKALIMSGTHTDITTKKQNEQKIIDIKERLENIIEGTNAGTWERNIQTNIEIVNKKWAEMLGYSLEEISPVDIKTLKRISHPEDFDKTEKKLQKAFNKEIKHYEAEFRMKHKNGEWRWINSRGKVTKWSDDGSPVIMSGTHIDITEKKEKEQKILEMKERLGNIIEGTNAGTWERNLLTGNAIIDEKWSEMIGYKLKELLPMNKKIWQSLICSQDLEKIEKNISKLINKEIQYYDVEFRMKHKNGMCIWVNGRGKISQYSKDGKPILISGTTINITEKKEKEKEIEYLSLHDTLTGLYNRRYMEDSIKRLDTIRKIPFSIIVSDINGLKLTNDAYGHEMGDELLKIVAKILKKSCRQEDIICRVGGDEFVILLPNVDEKKSEHIIQRISEESRNAKLGSVIISLAVGYSTKNKKEENILKIYKEADNNMYKDKIKYGKIMRNKTIETLLVNINNKYDNEQIHTERTSQYCENIARAMKLSEKEIQDAKIAGVLHDIGKITVNPEILNKKEKLTNEEFKEIKKHPSISYQLLKNVDEYSQFAEAVLYHHERIDGTGYPEGLREDEIPLLSRIIAVADAYEAMTANRPYQRTKTKEEALEELKKYSGTQFDEKIINIFINKVL